MKKIIVTFAAVLFAVVAFATDFIDKNIQLAFQAEFPGATHATWTTVKHANLYTVRFVHQGKTLIAYFDRDGNYLAIASAIVEENLPLPVKKSLRKIKPLGVVVTAEKITFLGETSYLFSFNENGQTKAYQIKEDGGRRRMRVKNIVTNS